MTDKLSKHGNFGYVTFKDASSLNKIQQIGVHVIDGKRVNCRIDDSAVNSSKIEQSSQSFSSYKSKKIFLGGLIQTVNEDDLFDYFCKYGSIEQCIVMRDKFSQKSRGFGFIVFTHEETVDKVMKNGNIHILQGKHFECKVAVPKDIISTNSDCKETQERKNTHDVKDKSNCSYFNDPPLFDISHNESNFVNVNSSNKFPKVNSFNNLNNRKDNNNSFKTRRNSKITVGNSTRGKQDENSSMRSHVLNIPKLSINSDCVYNGINSINSKNTVSNGNFKYSENINMENQNPRVLFSPTNTTGFSDVSIYDITMGGAPETSQIHTKRSSISSSSMKKGYNVDESYIGSNQNPYDIRSNFDNCNNYNDNNNMRGCQNQANNMQFNCSQMYGTFNYAPPIGNCMNSFKMTQLNQKFGPQSNQSLSYFQGGSFVNENAYINQKPYSPEVYIETNTAPQSHYTKSSLTNETRSQPKVNGELGSKATDQKNFQSNRSLLSRKKGTKKDSTMKCPLDW
eukprot:CAMPEP_0170527342 /NCGR_PEP_ID=MMETSP0209-20121228/12832_1 /TAXON_ID=665100 ORGANISM="Litonotus pictus, Strain P1" /NCGR_SAMPLE_ID=MMETSP0209 /ASSEMBLY_ACC=CAM_ASM_000301 /LENGTH=509 /DNA_ID=CAMNT_0010817823 /DNA_START=124 /DNA_END=1650 /DNA_ORIENTATION=-